tara:strand:+ start:537 stop:761 length:225 start_codon:yes stop_codon:yes gene_type:complete
MPNEIIIRTITNTRSGLNLDSEAKVETTELIEGELISTITEDTVDGTITTKTYADDIIIRKINGVEVARTIIKN